MSFHVADRDMLKLTQQEFETVPLIIKIEILIAAVTCMWGTNTALLFVHSIAMPNVGNTVLLTISAGSLIVSGDFKPVSALKNQRQELLVLLHMLMHNLLIICLTCFLLQRAGCQYDAGGLHVYES